MCASGACPNFYAAVVPEMFLENSSIIAGSGTWNYAGHDLAICVIPQLHDFFLI